MANKTYNEATIKYGDSVATYNGGEHTVATCVFTLKDNELTTVSGADAGSYLIEDNYANVLISAVEHHFCPFDLRYVKFNNNKITVNL
jgi:hypothetical protein